MYLSKGEWTEYANVYILEYWFDNVATSVITASYTSNHNLNGQSVTTTSHMDFEMNYVYPLILEEYLIHSSRA
jgi:hypothetical protein